MPARALPGTTVRLTSSGVPAIIQVTFAAGIASLHGDDRPRQVGGGRGHLGPDSGVHVDAVARPHLELVQALAAGHHRRAAVLALVQVEVERPVRAQRLAVLGAEAASRGLPSSSSPSISSTWRHGLSAPANASRLPASAAFEFAAPRA